ncbi:hypothetical protein MSG28_006234 [Choristoneura fumiferana]|uniref:Uncharacterized protein n=1 Tax=Choristoneura fumiferana TaxID=7141 RepID=A0ACC0JE66_CHOFU|nr:hypothetical protein MSG28_006234 [Choristoneura fumiferana]
MKFAADMKLGNTLTEKLKMTVISEVLQDLGLSGTEKTRCGNLSGGQRKRLSIALELIDNPPVVFLDEPTTGLDSVTSVQCIEMLKNLARSGRTIVCTVHQPSASIYALFDQVYILAEGMCVYHGASENTVPFLASVGLQCPKYHNPADYMLEIANGEYGSFNEMLAAECSKVDWTRPVLPAVPSAEKPPVFSYGKSTVAINEPHELYKFGVLFRRCFIQQYRDWTVTHLKVLVHILMGILLALIVGHCGSDGSKTLTNVGYLMISIVYLLYTSLMPGVLKFPAEMSIIKKETFNNWYSLKTYYIAQMVTGIPMQGWRARVERKDGHIASQRPGNLYEISLQAARIWFSFVFSAPSYFLTEQPQEMARFMMYVLVLAHVTLLADAVGNVIGTCVNPINGTFLGAISTCAMLVFGGYLVLLSHMARVMQIVSYGSFIRYAFEALMLCVYSYNRPPLDCPDDKLYCHMRHPKEVIKQFSFKMDNYWFDIGVLFGSIVCVRLLAFFTLRRSVKSSVCL